MKELLFCLFFLNLSLLNAQSNFTRILLQTNAPDSARIDAAYRLVKLLPKDSTVWLRDYLGTEVPQNGAPDWKGAHALAKAKCYILEGRLDKVVSSSDSSWTILRQYLSPQYKAYFLIFMGTVKAEIGDHATAMSFLDEAITMLGEHKSAYPELLGQGYFFKASIDFEGGRYLSALEHYRTAVSCAEQYGDLKTITNANVRRGCIFLEIGMEKEAKEAFILSLEHLKNWHDPYTLSTTYSYLIRVSETYQEARSYYENALKWSKESIVKNGQIHYDFGHQLEHFHQTDSAIVYFQKALEIDKATNNQRNVNTTETALGKILIQKGDVASGIKILEKTIPYLVQFNFSAHLITAYQALSTAYKSQKKPEQALLYLEKCVALKDSTQSDNIVKNVIRQYLDDIHEKEKEKINAENALAQLQAKSELQQQRIFTWGLGALALLLGALVFIFLKNLKERKAANEQLERLNRQLQNERESLAKSNQMLHGFALSISHDILNNIDLILSNGNILVDSSRNSKALGMYFDRTQHIGQQLKEYCLGLLESARSYQKQSVATAPLHDPNPTVQQIIERFRPLLEAKNFTVHYNTLPNTKIPLAVVSQVFQNLISNTIRYASDVPNPVLRIAAESPARWIIEDNGPGIPAHLQGDLFNKATQSDKGQGIGLVQVREILQKFEADISAENSPLGGARFVIVLSK